MVFADPGAGVADIELRFIGCATLRRTDGEWLELFPREALVLAMIAIDGPQARAEIAARLWSVGDPLLKLRQCLFKLTARTGSSPLLADRVKLLLRPGLRSDVGMHFHDAAGSRASGDLFGALRLPSLPQHGRAWVAQTRQRWSAVRARAVERDAALLLATNEPRAADALLERLLDIDPDHEHLWRRRMEIHAHLRDVDGTHAIFARWEEFLRSLSRVPAIETVALRRRIGASSEAASENPARPTERLAPAPFVGRRIEGESMQRAWDRGASFVLVGEAGIGKSRLVQRFLEGRTDTLAISAAEGDDTHPYTTTLGWLLPCRERWGLPTAERYLGELSRLLPDLQPAPTGAGHEAIMQVALIAVLRHASERGLAALVIDDLQFADSASLRLLQRCLASMPGLRFGFAMRDPGACDAAHPAQSLLAAGADIDVIALKGLSAGETRELMRALRLDAPGLESRAQELVGHCGGNPWYILDTLRDHVLRGETGAPFRVAGSVGEWMRAQLLRLSPGARVMAWLAATAGPDYDLLLGARSLEQPLDRAELAWRELQGARVLRGDTFAHDIVRQAVTRDVPPAFAREMHGRIAACMSARGASPQRLAHHYAGAEAWASAGRQAEAAAVQSERLGQRRAQLTWLDKAADWYRRAGMGMESQRAGTNALEPSVEHEGADAALSRIARLEASAALPSERAALEAGHARIALKTGDVEAAIAHARAALDTAAGAPQGQPLAVSVLAVALAWRGKSAEALEIIEPAIENVAAVTEQALRQDLLGSYALVLAHDERWREVVPVVRLALEEAQRCGSVAAEADMHNSLASACANLGQCAVAMDHARRSRELFSQMDAPEFTRVSSMNLARSLMACGEYAEAVAILQDILRNSVADAGAVLYLSTAENTLAELWLALGRTDRARLLLAADAPPAPILRRLTRIELRARAALQADSPDAPELRRLAFVAADTLDINPMRRLHTRLSLAAGLPAAEALADAGEALALARDRDSPVLALLARLRSAQAHLRCDQVARARAEATEALAEAEQVQHPWIHRPEPWLAAAQACSAAGDARAARRHFEAGRAWLRAVAARHLPSDCREAFERHPVHLALLAGQRATPCK